MNTRKWLITSGAVMLAALVMLALAVGLTRAQGPGPEGDINEVSRAEEAAAVRSVIPIQGRLTETDDSGTPLDGDYLITFSLYSSVEATTPLCQYDAHVSVDNGLFTAYIDHCTSSDIDGKQLYLGIQVEGDDEMTPRRSIDPVPYAWSLRPGAVISDTRSDAVLNVNNYGSGSGIEAYSQSSRGVSSYSSSGYGVYGFSNSSRGVYGESNSNDGVRGSSGSGNGVRGSSDSGCGVSSYSNVGAAICAEGSGVIQSSAKSYLWISGNGVRPYHQSDTTVIDMDSIGGAKVTPGEAAVAKHVMLPITISGPLYGQDVTVSALDIYWNGSTDMDAITDIRVRRQTGVCDSSSCYVNILHDSADYTCLETTGCTLHYDLTSNNTLTSGSGILYLTLQLTPIANDSWIQVGGARLTLEHD